VKLGTGFWCGSRIIIHPEGVPVSPLGDQFDIIRAEGTSRDCDRVGYRGNGRWQHDVGHP
jgi:hypothetical protein